MAKKKIAFVVAAPGTASVFLKDHFVALSQDFDVNLVANFADEESKKEFQTLGVTCHQAPIERSINLLKDASAISKLYKLFRSEKFDSIHSVTPKAGLLSAVSGFLARIPHRLHIFTGQVWATRQGIMRTVLKLMDKIVASLDTEILVDGASQRKFLIEEGVLKERNSCVLANGSISGVKMERFIISDEVRLAERRKFAFTAEDVVFLFMGRLNHDKGIGELYQAFDRLVADCPKAKMIFYGLDEEGYETKANEYHNIKRDVNFFYPGLTHTPYNALQCADVFVLPTWREGFGSSVIEASALGLPVITSDAYGVVDASVPNETGLRCGVNDPDGLFECMKYYYEHPEKRIEHGAAGRRRVAEKFDNNVVTASWVDYYKRLLGC